MFFFLSVCSNWWQWFILFSDVWSGSASLNFLCAVSLIWEEPQGSQIFCWCRQPHFFVTCRFAIFHPCWQPQVFCRDRTPQCSDGDQRREKIQGSGGWMPSLSVIYSHIICVHIIWMIIQISFTTWKPRQNVQGRSAEGNRHNSQEHIGTHKSRNLVRSGSATTIYKVQFRNKISITDVLNTWGRRISCAWWSEPQRSPQATTQLRNAFTSFYRNNEAGDLFFSVEWGLEFFVSNEIEPMIIWHLNIVPTLMIQP